MLKVKIFLFINLTFFSLITTQSDGNPHKWDRLRRCDNEDYFPECGLCEGIGGIPTSDKPEDIKLTTCTPIANATDVDNSTIATPYYPEVFTNTGFYEVLIGKKYDPFCLVSFPGPDSIGSHCYMPQQGEFYYDWPNKQLRIDYNKLYWPYNTTLTTYHNKGDMWIISNYKFLEMCVCNDLEFYPVNPDFLREESRYIGREKIMIEYLWEERVVDHWTRGPHHVWMDVETGYMIRLWQPFNGLEVYDPTKWSFEVDKNVFAVPPKSCTWKEGDWLRIGCEADGSVKHKNKNSKLSFLQ